MPIAHSTVGAEGRLAAQLEAWEAALARPASDEAFLRQWSLISARVAGLRADRDICALLESPAGRRFNGRLAAHQRRYLALAEDDAARRLLRHRPVARRDPRAMAQSGFAASTFARLEEAGELVDVDRGEVVVVGCGPLPAAALFFHRHAPACTVLALEVAVGAARTARAVARRHATPRLRVACRDGLQHHYGGAALIYVVNQVTPKAAVLRRIAGTAPRSVRVLVREPYGPGRLLADSAEPSLGPDWQVGARGAVDPRFHSRHLLLARR